MTNLLTSFLSCGAFVLVPVMLEWFLALPPKIRLNLPSAVVIGPRPPRPCKSCDGGSTANNNYGIVSKRI